jgi:hypothetical protein
LRQLRIGRDQTAKKKFRTAYHFILALLTGVIRLRLIDAALIGFSFPPLESIECSSSLFLLFILHTKYDMHIILF